MSLLRVAPLAAMLLVPLSLVVLRGDGKDELKPLMEYHYKAKVEHKIGVRKMIDTFMVETDNHVFALPGQKRLIRYQADFKDEAVPDVVLALEKDDLKKPGLVAAYTLNVGKGLLPPDRVAM